MHTFTCNHRYLLTTIVVQILSATQAVSAVSWPELVLDVEQTNCRANGKWLKFEPSYNYEPSLCGVDPRQQCRHKDNAGFIWREPKSCGLSEINANHLKAIFKGGQLVFFGDSLARNMKESMSCIVQLKGSNPDNLKYFQSYVPLQTTFSGKRNGKKTRDIDLGHSVFGTEIIEPTLNFALKNASALVIVYGHHLNAPFNHFHNPNTKDPTLAFEAGTKTMVKEIQQLDFTGPIVWVSYSPSHFDTGWNIGGTCSKNKSPQKRPHVYRQGGFSAWDFNAALLRGLSNATNNHRYLDVTTPSEYRSEAHPNRIISLGREDCVHWCLPGVADTWNELLVRLLSM
mmetsp:Transcript_32663/g.52347  ORF Transcript_32663/g.52347 Transcript_32663/m.52347 type:complete len:342 (+) Transcript_32663:270-1295(+)|eukprot:CAMPEP_0198683056 /NCGR_PEP_ID=MMETSP1468-20131203/9926_1 /TAXON_ID=1461545 /ORGANISM="Mantoniella sp, Strain CCMP1436" /LENGTH=341 /DNA_ID=CAMNT_0044426695 /DNA_START=197 /DNA_END=1222 /DNA_ORIENTATION=+